MDHEYIIAGKMEKFDGVLTGNGIEALKCDDLDDVLKLQKSQRFKDVMQRVEAALLKGSEVPEHEIVLKDLEYLRVLNSKLASFTTSFVTSTA